MEYVYHVVTERPMELGQKIIFNEENHNGVYNRVMTFKQIIDGEAVEGELAELIKSDMDKWGKTAFRELALEKVRKSKYSHYPSRMACLYTSRTLKESEDWAKFFSDIGRKVYSIVKLRVMGNVFEGDACNCFDGVGNDETDTENAEHYWKMDIENDRPIIETLVDGEMFVDEIIYDFTKANLKDVLV